MILRDYQLAAVERALTVATSGKERPRILIASPTGTGKSYIIIAIQEAMQQLLGLRVAVVSPRIEILAGIAAKAGHEVTKAKDLQNFNLWTPVRFRNALRAGKIEPYDAVIVDEGHHAVASVYQTLDAIHYALPIVGLTATPFRGNPRGTALLRDYWQEVYIAQSLPDAVAGGHCMLPRLEVVPLLDDDEVSLRSGEFQAKALEAEGRQRLDDLCTAIEHVWNTDKRPMLVSLPSTDLLHDCADMLEIPYCTVHQGTSADDRAEAFRLAVTREAALLQITVVSEGIDLPALRIWIDALPTMSPVRWLQTLGRISRPGKTRPRAIVFNRNLERHAYLLEGLLPPAKIAEAQQAFGGPSKRSSVRHLGLEAVGKFKAIEIPLASGVTTFGYSLYRWNQEEQRKVEYFAVVSPTTSDLLFARRVNQEVDGVMKYGKWQHAEEPKGFEGFQSTPKAWKASDKMKAWWTRAAGRHGLAATPPKSARVFQVLPVLANLGLKVE